MGAFTATFPVCGLNLSLFLTHMDPYAYRFKMK